MNNFKIMSTPKIYSSGFFYKIKTEKDEKYTYLIDCELLKGDSAFIFCEDEQSRPLVSRENKIFLGENKLFNFDISGKGKIIFFGLLFNEINIDYELYIKTIEIKKGTDCLNNIHNMILHKGSIALINNEKIIDISKYSNKFVSVNTKKNIEKKYIEKKNSNIKIITSSIQRGMNIKNKMISKTQNKETKNKITIIIPIISKDQKTGIIESILSQDYDNYDVSVVTNSEICDSIESNKKINIYIKNNATFGSAYNYGIRNCKSEYICLLRPDTYMGTKNILSKLMNNTDDELIYSDNNNWPTVFNNTNGVDKIIRDVGICLWKREFIEGKVGYLNEFLGINSYIEYYIRSMRYGNKIKHMRDIEINIDDNNSNVYDYNLLNNYYLNNEFIDEISKHRGNYFVVLCEGKYNLYPDRVCQIGKYIKTNKNKIFVEPSNENYINKINDNIIMSLEYFKMLYSELSNFTLLYGNIKYNDLVEKISPENIIFDLNLPIVDNNICTLNSINRSNIIICSNIKNKNNVKNIDNKKEIWYIPNGCEYELFKNIPDEIPRPCDIPKNKRKIIGYIGKINDDIDIDFIKRIADLRSYVIIMIGNIPRNSKIRFDHPCLKWIKNINYDKVPQYLKYFDICMLPYKENIAIDETQIKYYEYCAMNKLIIGTHEINGNKNYYKIDKDNIIIINEISNKKIEPNDVAQNHSWEKLTCIYDIDKI